MLPLVSPAFAAHIVSVEQARALVEQGATILDTRGSTSFLLGHLPGAVSVSWRIGVVGGARSGTLGDPDEAARAFAALGVSRDRPVLVVGDWTAGWGEEARIAWDLAYLGHPSLAVLDGGVAAWTGPWSYGPAWPKAGDFTAQVQPALRADRAAVRSGGAVIVDVREPDEFAGSNAYYAAYGGHIPGAVNLPWRGFPASAGSLPKDQPIVVYCTGGVRSAWAWLWLSDAGYAVRNYDGSWWDWAANEPR